MNTMQKGFTLIELMIVVAIVGILAAVAIPAYQDYTIRAQVTEGVSLASAAKAAVVESYGSNGSWPTDNTAAGLGTSSNIVGKYVTGVAVALNVVTVTFGGQANSAISNMTLMFTAGTSANGDVTWQCGSKQITGGGTITPGTTAFATTGNGGTLPQKYRPAECRG